MAYFPDQQFHGPEPDLFPYDIRFDPADAAHLSLTDDGTVRFRLVTEPRFASAHVVTDDGIGHELALAAASPSLQVWETALGLPTGTRYTFALQTDSGRAVYFVPAGISNAVERLDRWELDVDAIRRTDTPQWARGAVIYQIFPERFRNGDPTLDPDGVRPWGAEPRWLDFQGGDLLGVAEKADYLSDLGVDCVYVNPIFTSPSTHRYDAIDYTEVDPALGGNDALDRLVGELHERGIRIIVDASFNHCHPRFFAFADVIANGADSEFADWFVIREWPIRVKVRPTRLSEVRDPGEYRSYLRRFEQESGIPVVEVDDEGPAIECSYDAWYGVPSLPRIDLSNPAARRYFLDIGAMWVRDHGIDGWRMDVARYVDFDFWPEFRKEVRGVNPEAYLLAEIFGSASPWLQGDTFDATMNYTFRALALDFFASQEIDGAALVDGIVRMLAMYSPEVTANNQNLLGSHDTARFLHWAGERNERLRLATVFQMTMPGSPGVYYGDEVGMTGGEEPASRGAFPWHAEADWDRAQLRIVRELTRLRRSHPALRLGEFRAVWHSADAVAYTRTSGDDQVLVVINRGTSSVRLELPSHLLRAEPVWGHGTPAEVPAQSALIAVC